MSTRHPVHPERPRPSLRNAVATAMNLACGRHASGMDHAECDAQALDQWAAVAHAVEQGPGAWKTCPGSDEHEALADVVEEVSEVAQHSYAVALLRELAEADDVRAAVLTAAGECSEYLSVLLQRASAAEAAERQAGG